MPGDEQYTQLVVVGSSAGGIEALSSFVARLPTDFPAPIVLAQHLDPRRLSHLGDILSRHSTLPVITLAESEPLLPGTVYVVPANRHVAISDHDIRVFVDREDGKGGAPRPKPSIDLLLSSAAGVFGEGAIAIILTGTGSDGSAGANDVKRAGGTVIIQDPRTATYPALPMSLSPATVDFVANVEDIGPLVHELLTKPATPPDPDEEAALRGLLRQLQERQGIDFQGYKRPTIMRRLHRRMVAIGKTTIAEYTRYVQTHPEEAQKLIGSFLIKVTEFFRDVEAFEYLRREVIPDLVSEARQRGNELRLWSAGCATGEEAYSLAILIAEMLRDELARFHVRVFGTDLDNDAIEFARRGVYPSSALTNLDKDLVNRYFTELEGEFHVKKHIRSMVVFGQHDLSERAPFPNIDLIMCRNVMIYFAAELQRHVLELCAFSLRDGGYLVLGKAETITPAADYFIPQQSSLKIYRRRGDRIPMAPMRVMQVYHPLPIKATLNRPEVTHMELSSIERERQRALASRQKAESALHGLPVGLVIVNRRYDIQTINTAARRLLGIHGSAIGEDFVHLARSLPARPLRSAIDAAFRGRETSSLDEVAVALAPSDEERYLRIECHAQPEHSTESTGNSVLVLITDMTGPARQRRELELANRQQREEAERLRGQVRRLTDANYELAEANQELADTNMELRSANEEFLVGNEELQAATEEVETLNEELQATNEELETLNEELQATVEELNTTNDDLQARSVELQDLAVSLEQERQASETERARLAAILVSMGDAVLVVDESGSSVLTNAEYEAAFGGPNSRFSAEDLTGVPLPDEQTPQQRTARGESFTVQFTTSSPDGSRRWYEAEGRPISNGGSAGGVLVIRDITDRSLRRLQDDFLSSASHELRTPLTVLKGYITMITRAEGEGDGDTKSRRYANLALDQVRRLEALIRDLMDASRLQSGGFSLSTQEVDLVSVVAEAVEAAQTLTNGQQIRFETRSKHVPIEGDPARLQQVLLNLVTNAITYAPESEQVDVRLKRAGHRAEIQVQDYGPGIPASDLPNVFTRLYTVAQPSPSSRGGLGLGLFIAKELVSAHGGEIEIQSVEGHGTTVTIRLPILRRGTS